MLSNALMTGMATKYAMNYLEKTISLKGILDVALGRAPAPPGIKNFCSGLGDWLDTGENMKVFEVALEEILSREPSLLEFYEAKAPLLSIILGTENTQPATVISTLVHNIGGHYGS